MLFNSYEFLIFLIIVVSGFFILSKYRLLKLSKLWIILSSLFFYAYWDYNYVALILFSIIFNYSVGLALDRYKKLSLLWFGILVNLSLLGYYKYTNFFIESLNFLTESNFDTLQIILPLAISFYTFQQIAYLIDSYEGIAKEHSFTEYVLFILFFPQLLAGPIVHHKEMMPQFNKIKTYVINYRNIVLGIFIFSLGLFKKVFFADNLAIWVNDIFANPADITFVEAWIGSIGFLFQVYFDFSAYSEMAIGAALLFNIKLPINFNSPLKSRNMAEFWSKWHITLMNFLTVYIYTPLLMQFKKITLLKQVLVIYITWILSGIWHGAGVNFIIFGFLLGFYYSVYYINKQYKIIKLPKIISVFITFMAVAVSVVFFRAETLADAMLILEAMLNIEYLGTNINNYFNIIKRFEVHILTHLLALIDIQFTITMFKYIAFIFLLSFIVVFFSRNVIELSKDFKPTKKYLFIIISSIIISLFSLQESSEFLYFHF